MTKLKAAVFIALCLIGSVAFSQVLPAVGGQFRAADYNFFAKIATGSPSGSGSQAFQISLPGGISLNNGGRTLQLFAVDAPLLIGSGSNQETATPTAVSGCNIVGNTLGTCTVTVTVTNSHGPGDIIQSGTFGLQEAINDASGVFSNFGGAAGGEVIVDNFWQQLGGTTAMLVAATPFGTVVIEDRRAGVNIWSPTQNVATVLAAPATGTAATVGFGLNGANTTGGTYTGASTYHTNCAYVDPMGNEGPASADFSALTAGSGTTNQIGFAFPVASTGAVGYVCYISLAGGTYNLSYQVPITSSTCTLTKIETVTPACAVPNTTYGQAGSNLIVSALTVNSAPLHLLATTASTTSAYIGTPSGRTVYKYAPHGLSQAATSGWTSAQQAYAISVAPATTVPEVIATVPVPIGFMNNPGAQVRICGLANEAANGSTATVQNFEFLWDAAGSNTTGAPVIIGQLQLTATLVTANADHWSWCWQGQTTVSGAGVTAGTIAAVGGQLCSTYGAGVLGNCGVDVLTSTGSLNLAGTGGNTQRIHVVWLHTTNTDANGVTVNGLTVEVL